MNLSQSAIESFRQDGYLILDLRFDHLLLDKTIEGVSPLYPDLGSDSSYLHGMRLQDAWRFEPHVRKIALDDRVLQALRELFGREPLPFQTLNFPVGTQQKAHSDTIHFNSRPSGYMAGVWVALEDTDEDNGALIYYPGSHLLPEVTIQEVGVSAREENYFAYENYIETVVEEQELEPARGVMRKGQVFVWHANLLHGGGEHIDQDQTRHSQVTHYFFEGCQYYTPMMSTESKLWLRDPEWITAGAPYRDQSEYRDGTERASTFKRLGRRLKAIGNLRRGY